MDRLMELSDRIRSFVMLGERLKAGIPEFSGETDPLLEKAITGAGLENPWFIREFVLAAVEWICRRMTEEGLSAWLAPYAGRLAERRTPKTVAVVMAGNIPLVGFHDLLSVLLTGNRIVAKTSSKDSVLMNEIIRILCSCEPGWSERIRVGEEKLKDFDAVIATGSDNSARLFDYYFGKYPRLVRRNRNGIAVLEGGEKDEDLDAIATDVFQFFGLGCRSVSKMFLPAGYDLHRFDSSFSRYKFLMDNHRYHNNYLYHKSVFLVGTLPFIDFGNLLMTESRTCASPVAVVHYEFYDRPGELSLRLEEDRDRIQCIVSATPVKPGTVPPGKTQDPGLADYADGADTVDFLLNL